MTLMVRNSAYWAHMSSCKENMYLATLSPVFAVCLISVDEKVPFSFPFVGKVDTNLASQYDFEPSQICQHFGTSCGKNSAFAS